MHIHIHVGCIIMYIRLMFSYVYMFICSPINFSTALAFRSETSDCSRYCKFFVFASLLYLVCS